MLLVRVFALATAFMMVCPIPLLSAPAAAAGRSQVPAAPPSPAASPVPAAIPPFGIGDWMVNGTETLADRSFVLDGCLTVGDGGELTVSNSTLVVKSAFDDQHEIRVLAGGTLRVLDCSTVSAFDASRRFGFFVDPGGRVEFRDSVFVSAGLQDRYLTNQSDSNDPDYDTVVGGIVLQSQQSEISNCTFMGLPIAMTVLKTDCTLENCTFDDNFIGAYSHNSRTTFLNCTFTRNTMGQVVWTRIGAGAWCWRSLSVFNGCSFSDNYAGIAVDNSSCTATNCSFTRNDPAGVYVCGFTSYEDQTGPGPCGVSETKVEDCGFTENTLGIMRGIEGWLGTQPLHVVNCDFSGDTMCGIWWENRIDPTLKYQPPAWWPVQPHAVWNVTGSSTVTDDLMIFNGSIGVEAGGSLELRHSKLQMDCAGPLEDGIDILGGGRLVLADGSTLDASMPRWPYSLRCLGGSALELDASHLRDCGLDTGIPSESGVFLDGSDCVVNHSVLDNCPYGLVLSAGASALVDASSISGALLAARLDNSTLELANSTAGSNGTSCAVLDNGSELVCLNSSLDRSRVAFQDGASRLEIGWYLDLRVVWSDGRPAAGASVKIDDLSGNDVINTTTDAEGRVGDTVLWETTMWAGGKTYLTPHTVRCSFGPVSNTSSVTADRGRSLTVVLVDSLPPAVTFLAPAPGSLFNSSSVALAGTAGDDLGLRSVELTVDGHERYMLYEGSAGELRDLDWNLNLQMAEGVHTAEVDASDTSGNANSTSIDFTVDYTAPRIIMLLPKEGFLTDLPEVAVSGLMEPGSRVFVNGEEARTLGGTFNAVALLSEGDNVLTAGAVDAAGNSNSSSVHVRLDTTPPRLDLSFLPDAAVVNQPRIDITGSMEFGASITINGRLAVVPGLADNFTTQFTLVPGNNTITISATDAAGNVNTTERRFVLDTVPPAFTVLRPPEGFQTREPFLTLDMLAEAGTDLTVGSTTATVPGPAGEHVQFSANWTLVEGANAITMTARDAAGNTFTVIRDVVLDTIAPSLSVQSPPDGYHTSNGSVYVIGTTDPDATVTVNGEAVAVGYTGAFSAEVVLAAGHNAMTVVASDALGNSNTTTVNVTRVASRGSEELATVPGPDWPFIGFVLVAACVVVSEGYWASRFARRPGRAAGPSKGGG